MNKEITYVFSYNDKCVELAMLRGLAAAGCNEHVKARSLYLEALNNGQSAKDAAKCTLMEMFPPESAIYQVAYNKFMQCI